MEKHFNDEIFRQEMNRLHMSETNELFADKDTSTHVFLDFEMMHSDIAGCASWIKRDNNFVEDLDGKIILLKKHALYIVPKLLNWIITNKDTYPAFVSHCLLMDQIRHYVLELFLSYQGESL